MNKYLEQDIEFLRQRIYLDEEDISELSDSFKRINVFGLF